MNLQSVIGGNVRRLRLARGLLVHELAARAEFSLARLVSLEKGRANITAAALERVARALDVEEAALVAR